MVIWLPERKMWFLIDVMNLLGAPGAQSWISTSCMWREQFSFDLGNNFIKSDIDNLIIFTNFMNINISI